VLMMLIMLLGVGCARFVGSREDMLDSLALIWLISIMSSLTDPIYHCQ
jgi:hypothetical protein